MTFCAEKELLRAILKEKRAALPLTRIKEAPYALLEVVYPLLQSFRYILSFHSFGSEINTSLLNEQLATENRLLLPKICENTLIAYQVTQLPKQFLFSDKQFKEPDPKQCPVIDIESIGCALIPGLGFDHHFRRVGYGKGHYDRFLEQFKKLAHTPLTIGIGFKEQLSEKPLPYEKHDLTLDKLILV